MKQNKDEIGYPFGIYLCQCQYLYIWYPDSKKNKKLNFFPKTIKCECGQEIKITEKLRVTDIWKDLVPLFRETIKKYKFKKLMMIDEEHVHLIWQKNNISSEIY